MYGGFSFGSRNEEGIKYLEFHNENDLVVYNTSFRRPASDLIIYQPGEYLIQVDYILTRVRDR